MFSATTYTNRRNQLKKNISNGLILLFGNNDLGMNCIANTYHFRQDSNFLYFFGINQAGLSAVIDVDSGEDILFGNDRTIDDVVWEGSQPTMRELADRVGAKTTKPFADLSEMIKKAVAEGRDVHFLPPYRFENKLRLQDWLNIPATEQKSKASKALIHALINQRSYKSAEEIVEMEKAVNISRAMHHAVMRGAKAGKKEAELAGLAQAIAVSTEGNLAYPVILSKDGQTLHNHHHSNILQNGDLVLGDFGGETKSCYAGDITRTFPVSKVFTSKQRDIYNIVLKAEEDSIAALKPGVPYQQIHLGAAKIIANGLKDLGLMKGDVDAAVEQGAHALFFPHGLGHMIGLDVHDMEDLGEDFVGYSDTIKRSELFGTAYLRLGRELEAGFVLTVEPGIYFIPELIAAWQADKKFSEFINYDKVNAYRGFGGIRIEDNILVTDTGHRVLGERIAKTVEEVEALRE
ncbi:MAG: Xaa-Pro aminopeptidase [Paraglaciecola sp.]|jgi:Xaa-Pro aminopeptidase